MTRLRDVTLRDGLQDEAPLETDAKIALFGHLIAAGITDLELTSFTRPDRIPAMADAEELARKVLLIDSGARLWGLVLNRRGAERAIGAGLNNFQFVLSVSETHNRQNAGRSVAASLEALGKVIDLAEEAGAQVEVTLATAFGCPFEGPVGPGAVLDVVRRVGGLGATRLTLADTIGTAVPNEVRALTLATRSEGNFAELGLHLHDTRGLALVNAMAGVDAGIDRLDGTVGGLGGCPFAPGASGNLPLEDLVHLFEATGLPTGIDLERLLKASMVACDLVHRSPTSHVAVAGPRFARRAMTAGSC